MFRFNFGNFTRSHMYIIIRTMDKEGYTNPENGSKGYRGLHGGEGLVNIYASFFALVFGLPDVQNPCGAFRRSKKTSERRNWRV